MTVLSKYYLPALGWALLILFLTLAPPQALPKVPKWDLISIHSLAHAFVFMVWAFLLLYGFSRAKSSASFRHYTAWITMLLAISYGALIELLQGVMQLGRQPDIFDIVYNTIGAVLGLLLFYLGRKSLWLV